MPLNAATFFGLTLRPTTTTAAVPAAAWFIAGDDVAGWLDELAGWGVPLAGLRLYPVPTSGRSREPCGVLAIAEGKPTVNRALPYAVVAGRLFYPADAAVEPPVAADELAAALRHDVVVLHPTAGLVGFGAEDGLRVADLLTPPPRRAADWSHADGGPDPLPRLVAVDAEPLPADVRAVLEQGQDDIGSDADEPVPDDRGEGKRSIGSFLKSLLPGGKAVDDSVQAKRDRELNRLLEMLKTDPDQGLRHALPLWALPGRGVASPGASLGRRDVNFNLANLSAGGGRPGDAWHVAQEMRQQLLARYREAANRELNLGRHRRAAYIFAHLLGDFSAAALSLQQGRHFREAAALYTDKLNNPRAAADCLAAGGLVAEAIPLYWDLLLYERAGDLHAQIGEPATAADCYRHAVRQCLDRNDPVAAARLLENKLAAGDEALAVLAERWPESDKAGVCLAEWFDTAARLGRHDEAAARAGALRDAAVPDHRAATLVERLSAVATAYPNAVVRHRAADVTRALVGRRLASADSVDRRAMVRAVVAVGEGAAQVYRKSAGAELALAGGFDVPVRRPVAVLPAGAGLVAAIDADGGVYVCRCAE